MRSARIRNKSVEFIKIIYSQKSQFYLQDVNVTKATNCYDLS